MSEGRILRSFPPEKEWDNDCDIVVRVWSDEPTPEEIKAQHPPCKSCEMNTDEEMGIPWCYQWDRAIKDELTDYCNHHEPKET